MVVLGKCFGINGVWISNPLSEAIVLLFNVMIAWRTCGHFPAALRTTDCCKIKLKEIPHNRGGSLTDDFQPSASCCPYCAVFSYTNLNLNLYNHAASFPPYRR